MDYLDWEEKMSNRVIIERLEVGDVNNCTYVIVDTMKKVAVLIDPAWELEKIIACLNSHNASLHAILLTHSHYDHTNLVLPLVQRFSCIVYMASKEIDFYGFKSDNLVPVSDLEIIRIGNLEFECILTPGHSAGSMCFRIENNLFTGDTVFIRSCGYCNCKGGSYNEMFESIKKIKEIALKDEIAIYPGHYFRNDYEHQKEFLKRNLYFHIKDIETFIKFASLSDKKNMYLKYEYKN